MTKEELIIYGEACFGRSWHAQLASELNVDRRRVNDWLTSEKSLPSFLDKEIEEILYRRRNEILKAIEYKDNFDFAVQNAIDHFKMLHISKIKDGTLLWYKVSVEIVQSREIFSVEITLENKEGREGWYKHVFDEMNLSKDIIFFDKLMKQKISKDKAEMKI